MAGPKEFLVEWTERLIRHNDMLLKKIKSIDKGIDGFDIIARQEPKDKYIIVEPFLENVEAVRSLLKEDVKAMLVVYNTKENLDVLFREWKQLNNFPEFCIMFVNPFSELDLKWIVCPYTHDKVTEKDSFVTGLKALFESVTAATESQIESNIKRA